MMVRNGAMVPIVQWGIALKHLSFREGLGYVKIEELKFVFSHLEDKMPPDEVEEMIKEADHDGNGQISYDGKALDD